MYPIISGIAFPRNVVNGFLHKSLQVIDRWMGQVLKEITIPANSKDEIWSVWLIFSLIVLTQKNLVSQ